MLSTVLRCCCGILLTVHLVNRLQQSKEWNGQQQQQQPWLLHEHQYHHLLFSALHLAISTPHLLFSALRLATSRAPTHPPQAQNPPEPTAEVPKWRQLNIKETGMLQGVTSIHHSRLLHFLACPVTYHSWQQQHHHHCHHYQQQQHTRTCVLIL